MKTTDFNSACQNTPQVVAVFTLTKDQSEGLISKGYDKGELFYYHPNGCMIPLKGGIALGTHASKFSFKGYYYFNQETKQLKGKI
jgi:hypothetical protein